MIRHLALFTLTDKARDEGLEKVLDKLRNSAVNMVGKIPGLLKAELSLNGAKDSPHDLVFYSEFEDLAALDGYQHNPIHEEHKRFAREYVGNQEVVDLF
jgi:quinol monooxygenase YgiN